MLAAAAIFEDTALAIQQGLPAPLWRHPGGGLQAETPAQGTDTGEGKEGKGEMGADAGRRPVEDRSHPEIVLVDAEAFLDWPPAVVLVEEFGQRHPPHVGDEAAEAVPAGGVCGPVGVEGDPGFAVDSQEAALGMTGPQGGGSPTLLPFAHLPLAVGEPLVVRNFPARIPSGLRTSGNILRETGPIARLTEEES